jgi:hypothetical protein
MVVINGMRTCGVNRTAALPPNSDYGSVVRNSTGCSYDYEDSLAYWGPLFEVDQLHTYRIIRLTGRKCP